MLNLKRDINVNIAHAGLDIIRSRDPLYKQEIVLKKLFKPKEFGGKILDKNHIANKHRQKYLRDMKKEKRKA